MAKQLLYADEAKRKMGAGVKKLADAARITLGPTGRGTSWRRGGGSSGFGSNAATLYSSTQRALRTQRTAVKGSKGMGRGREIGVWSGARPGARQAAQGV